MRTPDATYAVVISWEVFFANRARDAIGNGGEVLLNPTNGSSYWLTRCRPSRWRRRGCAPSRPGAGRCRPRPPASARSSRPTARSPSAPASASSRVLQQPPSEAPRATRSPPRRPVADVACAGPRHGRRLAPARAGPPTPTRRRLPSATSRPGSRAPQADAAGGLREIDGAGECEGVEEAAVVGHQQRACPRSRRGPARAARWPRGRGGWSARRAPGS